MASRSFTKIVRQNGLDLTEALSAVRQAAIVQFFRLYKSDRKEHKKEQRLYYIFTEKKQLLPNS